LIYEVDGGGRDKKYVPLAGLKKWKLCIRNAYRLGILI